MLKKLGSLNQLLPLVAIGTIADCQSVLEPTNRLLVRSGLSILNNQQNKIAGLGALLDQTGFSDKQTQGYQIRSQDLAFIFSPILNSSGRISHAKLSIATLLADHNQTKTELQNPSQLAKELIQTNHERKELVQGLLQEVDLQSQIQFDSGQKVIWLEGDWSKGIVGLLASRLVSRYNLPVIVISSEEDRLSASLRAPSGYHLPRAMTEIQEKNALFEKFGGHPGAAGFTTTKENVPQIHAQLAQLLEIQSQTLVGQRESFADPEIIAEMPESMKQLAFQKNLIWLHQNEINSTFLNELELLDPFGQDFPYPFLIFKLDNFSLHWMGSDQNHVKISFNQNQKATLFRVESETKSKLNQASVEKTPIWLMAKVSQNTWNGSTNLELIAQECWIQGING